MHEKLLKDNIKKIIILCRGSSLRNFKFFSEIDEKTVIVFVNSIRDHLENKWMIEKANKTKYNVQFINNDSLNVENKKVLEKFNVSYIHSNKKKSDPDIPRLLIHKKNIEKDYQKIFFIPEDFKDSNYKLKSNGMSALGYFSSIEFIEEIVIFGLDFFESNYYNFHIHTGKKEVKEIQPKKGQIAKKQFEEIVSNYNKKYLIYTDAQIDIMHENLKVFN